MASTIEDAAVSATLRLAHARNIGPVTYRKLVRVFGSAEAVLAAPRERILEVPDVTPRTADGIADARKDPWADEEVARARERKVEIVRVCVTLVADFLIFLTKRIDSKAGGRFCEVPYA